MKALQSHPRLYRGRSVWLNFWVKYTATFARGIARFPILSVWGARG